MDFEASRISGSGLKKGWEVYESSAILAEKIGTKPGSFITPRRLREKTGDSLRVKQKQRQRRFYGDTDRKRMRCPPK